MDTAAMKDFILKKTDKLMRETGDRLPEGTVDGKYFYKPNAEYGGWTGGFWIGLLNYCYLMSGDKSYLEYAEMPRHRLVDRLYNMPETLDHDVGFLYLLSEYARYEIQGKEESLKVVIDAADSLAERYNEKGRFIRAWADWGGEFGKNNLGRIIIDCMYNLPLLFIASEKTGDKKYYDIAVAHADTCINSIVREDGTTFHTFVFDPETGAKRFGQTCQGWSDDSCWSRGQSWAIGGFAMAYRYAKDKKYIEVAKKAADKFIELLEPDYMPKWDFVFKGRDDMPGDSSAAAIAASGLLELAEYVPEDDAKRYRDVSDKMVEMLWNKCAILDMDTDGLIGHATGHYKANAWVDTNLIFADYYFAESVAKRLGIKPIV